jgi:hypothetical protein
MREVDCDIVLGGEVAQQLRDRIHFVVEVFRDTMRLYERIEDD